MASGLSWYRVLLWEDFMATDLDVTQEPDRFQVWHSAKLYGSRGAPDQELLVKSLLHSDLEQFLKAQA